MRVRILQTALDDLAAGQRFYARQEHDLGSHFLRSLFADIDSLPHQAGIHPVRYGFNRLLAKRFPYAVYYRLTGNDVIVFRVLDCRRDPRLTRRLLENEG